MMTITEKNIRNFFLLAFIFLFSSVNGQVSYDINLGYSISIGGNSNYDLLNPGNGVKLGISRLSRLEQSNVSWMLGSSLLYSGTAVDTRDSLLQNNTFDDVTFSNFLDISFNTGIQYIESITDGIEIFGALNLGPNLLKITNFEVKGVIENYRLEMKPSVEFGYGLEFGIIVNNQVIISCHYQGFGTHDVSVLERRENLSFGDITEYVERRNVKLNQIGINLGYRL